MSVVPEALELKLQPLQWLLEPVLGSLRAAVPSLQSLLQLCSALPRLHL